MVLAARLPLHLLRGALLFGLAMWLGDKLDETRRQCDHAGGKCQAAIVNVRVRSEIFAFVERILDAEGKVDILVNNAAAAVLGQVGRPLEVITEEDWDSIFEVNTRGAFYFAQAVAPAMKSNGGGRIVNISSGAGLGVSLTGNSGLCFGKGGADRINASTGARARRMEYHCQQYRPRIRPLQPELDPTI